MPCRASVRVVALNGQNPLLKLVDGSYGDSGDAGHARIVCNYGPWQNDGARLYPTPLTDRRRLQHRRVVSDARIPSHAHRMNHRADADMRALANLRRAGNRPNTAPVNDGSFENRCVPPNDNAAHLRPQNRARPNARPLVDLYIAHQIGVIGDPRGRMYNGRPALNCAYRHEIYGHIIDGAAA